MLFGGMRAFARKVKILGRDVTDCNVCMEGSEVGTRIIGIECGVECDDECDV
jgi:hypothetical protein